MDGTTGTDSAPSRLTAAVLLNVFSIGGDGFLTVNFANINYSLETLGVGGAPLMEKRALLGQGLFHLV